MNYCFHLVALVGLHYPQQQFGLARPGQLRKHLNTMVACVEERASLSLFISQQIVRHTQPIDLSMALDIDCGATVESTAKHIWTGRRQGKLRKGPGSTLRNMETSADGPCHVGGG